jgi:hypothetical protein
VEELSGREGDRPGVPGKACPGSGCHAGSL